jgi:hypothetical protein
MDRFIVQSGVDEDWWGLVFVDCIDEYYDEASAAPMEMDSDPDSPFIGKTPQECHQLLLKLRDDTESEIIPDHFIIMDERSTQDDTVLLVCVERDNGGENEVSDMPILRATFQCSAQKLMLYEMGHCGIHEDAITIAEEEEEDDVYRG